MSRLLYKLKENAIDIKGEFPVQEYLKSLGIEKTDRFLFMPQEWDQLDPRLLDNIEEAVEMLHEGFTNNKTFYLQPDADVDGYTSAAIFYRYFKDLYPDVKIHWEVHEGKEHGIKLDKIPVWVDYIIIPDAGSNNFDEQEFLSNRGQKVVIIDHHSMDTIQEFENVVIVNNQTSDRFENKFLSGAGMVYKVIQRYDERYIGEKTHEKFLDLAAIGIVSDMMDTRELDNNYIIYHGLRNINNPLMKAILERQSYSVSSITNPNKIDIAFYVAPLINGLIRMGSVEENTEFFAALIDYHNTETFVRFGRTGMVSESLYDKVAREAANTRSRQNTLKEKVMNFLDTQVQEQKLYENSIITVVASNTDVVQLPRTLTGLVAMEFVKKYKKPVLVLRPRTENGINYYAGSGRSRSIEGFMSLRDELNISEIVDYAEGHDNAFGVQLKVEDLNKLNQYFNLKFPDLNFGSEVIEVDGIFENEIINAKALYEFAEVNHIYGNQIPQPRFAFKFILNNHTFKVLGANKNTATIKQDEITFIQFHADETVEIITKGDTKDYSAKGNHEIIIIGRPQINEYRGMKNLQVIVDDISIEEIKGKNLL